MKIFLIALVVMLGLSGCASEPANLGGDTTYQSTGFGTLADANDPVEVAAAPIVNKLALYTHIIATHLKLGYINRSQAIFLRERERTLRAKIEVAVAGKSVSNLQSVATELDGYFNELVGK